jgi:hypothetical protein
MSTLARLIWIGRGNIGTLSALRYRELPPRPGVRQAVRCLWFLEDEAGAPPEKILPDG